MIVIRRAEGANPIRPNAENASRSASTGRREASIRMLASGMIKN